MLVEFVCRREGCRCWGEFASSGVTAAWDRLVVASSPLGRVEAPPAEELLAVGGTWRLSAADG